MFINISKFIYTYYFYIINLIKSRNLLISITLINYCNLNLIKSEYLEGKIIYKHINVKTNLENLSLIQFNVY